jgi:hypothetical protein
MMKNAQLMMAGAIALTAALSGCGKHAAAPQAVAAAPAPASVAAPEVPKSTKVSFFGSLNDAAWYFVVTSPNPNTKPMAIQVDTKESCDRTAIKFSLKAVDPASKSEPPKSWCMSGKDLRAQLGA